MHAQATPKIRLNRLASGKYQTEDGRWTITRRGADAEYGGREEWFAKESAGDGLHGASLDPQPTLRDVRATLAAAYLAEQRSVENDPASGFYKPPPSPHGIRAAELLEQALGEVRSNIDAIPTVSEVLANLRAEMGELPEDEAAELLISDSDEQE